MLNNTNVYGSATDGRRCICAGQTLMCAYQMTAVFCVKEEEKEIE